MGHTLEHLLELVISQLKKCLDNEMHTNILENPNDTLINNACDLLNRLVAELAFNAVGEVFIFPSFDICLSIKNKYLFDFAVERRSTQLTRIYN